MPERNLSETIFYWKSFWRLRRDFPVTFPSELASERLASAIVVVAGQRREAAVLLLMGAIGAIPFKPNHLELAPGDPEPRFESMRLFE